jgi:hypothetical protein
MNLHILGHLGIEPLLGFFTFSNISANYKKGCTRLACDKVYQLLAHGQWFSPDTPASSTTKTGRHYIAEILLKVKKPSSSDAYTIIIHFSDVTLLFEQWIIFLVYSFVFV